MVRSHPSPIGPRTSKYMRHPHPAGAQNHGGMEVTMKARLTTSAWILVAMLVLSAAGYAQGWHWSGGNSYVSYQDRDDNRFYREGFRDGANDARAGLSYHTRSYGFGDRDDRDAYQAGYNAGYNQEVALMRGY